MGLRAGDSVEPDGHVEPAEDDHWQDEDYWEEEEVSRARVVIKIVAVVAALVLVVWILTRVLGDGADGGGDNAGDKSGQELVDRTGTATARAPRTAPPNEDVEGNPTAYDASNMLDGVPETAWRAPGDRKGLKLTFTFPEKTLISEIGLINGYAKDATDDSGTTIDWYLGHRRITAVTWNLGGTVVRQELTDERGLQTVEVKPVEVRKIVLKIVKTTPPGKGAAGRNFTAISDVRLAG